MRLLMRLPHLPGRLAAGAFILNSGLDMRNADRQTAEATYGMAKNAYPFLGRLDPETFVKLLSTAEIAIEREPMRRPSRATSRHAFQHPSAAPAISSDKAQPCPPPRRSSHEPKAAPARMGRATDQPTIPK